MTSCESRHFFRPWNNDIDSNSDCGSSTTSSSPASSSISNSSRTSNNNNDSMFCEDSSRESCANSLTTLKNFVDSATTDARKSDKVITEGNCPTAAAAAAAAAWYYQHPCYPTDYPDPHWIQEYQSMQLAVSEISRQEALAKQAKKLRPKKFKCDYCPMTFSNNGQLQGHLRIHTGERPFKCLHEGCGKTFTRNEELTRHKRIHTGLRPYACSLCRKKFGRKDHLKKHSKTHENRTLYHPLTSAAFMPFSFPPAQGLAPFFYI